MKKLLLISAAAALLAACSNDSENIAVNNSDELVPLQISGNIDVSTETATRAVGDAWETGDAIGIYATTDNTKTTWAYGNAPGTSCADIQYNFADGANYDTSGGSIYRAFNPQSTQIYMPANGANVDIYAYYPHSTVTPVTATSIDNIAVNLGTQNPQKNIDFMMASHADRNKANYTALLQFKHQLSKLVFNISKGTGMSDADITNNDITVTIGSQKLKGTFDISHVGASTATKPLTVPLDENAATTITAVQTAATSTTKTFEAIVLPNKTANDEAIITNNDPTDHLVTITISKADPASSASYEFTIHSTGSTPPVVSSFDAGKKYTFNIQVNAKALTVTASISNWGDGGTYDDVIAQ